MTYTPDVRDGTEPGNTDPSKCHICGAYAPNRCITCGERTCWDCAENPGVCFECVAIEVSAEVENEEAAIAAEGGCDDGL